MNIQHTPDRPLSVRFLQDRPLATGAFFLLLGTCAGVWTNAPWQGIAVSGGICAVLALILAVMKKRCARAVCMLAILLLSCGRACMDARMPEPVDVWRAEITGTVCSDPVVQPERERAYFSAKDVTVNGEAIAGTVRIYAYASCEELSSITFADYFEWTGGYHIPVEKSNPGTFSYGKWLHENGYRGYVTLSGGMPQMTDVDGGWMEKIYEAKRVLISRIESAFPENSSLMRALLIGDKSDMSDDEKEMFSSAGVAHLFAVSGLHVTVLAMAVTYLLILLCLPKWLSVGAVTAFLMAYSVLTGFPVSVMRAGIMYILMAASPLLGRKSDSLTRLGIAASVILLIRPLAVCQSGFMLSFAAVFGLLTLSDPINHLLKLGKRPVPAHAGIVRTALGGILNFLLSTISASLCAQIATLPFVINLYGEVPLLGLIANLPAIPAALASIVGGAFVTALSVPFPALVILGKPVDVLLSGLVWIIGRMNEWPGTMIALPSMAVWGTAAFFTVMFSSSAFAGGTVKRRKWRVLLLPVIVALAVWMPAMSTQGSGLDITFLDVGQADSAIVNAQGTYYLVDVGQDGTCASAVQAQATGIKAIFLSHAHDDHAGGLDEVLEICTPETIYIPEDFYCNDMDNQSVQAVQNAKSKGIQVVTLTAGETVPLSEDVSAQVIWPVDGFVPADGNESSMVMRVEYGDSRVLFTGDFPDTLQEMDFGDCTVLKVPHHGAGNGMSWNLLYESTPAVAVISVGKGNSYGHPSPGVVGMLESAGCAVYRTDVSGAVQAHMSGDGSVRMETYGK